MKNFLKILSTVSFYVLTFSVSYAEVSSVIFTTSPQTIKPNIISEPITIQSQDENGDPKQTEETIDLEFSSTSGTGEFLGSTGNPATKYMSTNTANRTFYYRDSSLGSFTITVRATGRISGRNWSDSQQITISDMISASDQTQTLNDQVSNKNSSSSSNKSSASSLSSVSSGGGLEVSISGGDRLTSPGSPISFQAIVKKSPGSDSKISFSWSYGDGSVGKGEISSHTYKYTGEYAVVLTAKYGNNFSVSRIKVKVVEADLSMEVGDGYIEISNNSNNEINMFNWQLLSKGKGFIFQPDTIILPKSKIKIDESLLTMTNKGIQTTVLKNYLGEDILIVGQNSVQPDTTKISLEIEEINKKALALLEQIPVSGEVAGASLSNTEDKPEPIKEPKKVLIGDTATAEGVIYEAPKKKSFFSKLTNFIKRVFSD